MLDAVPYIDTKSLPWLRQQAPGIYSKLLLKDNSTGGRTAINRVVPSEGMTPPGKPHFHRTSEELLIIKGCLSFDSKQWLTPYSYCFHPPGTVHGFKSIVKEETWFISRIGNQLDFNFVDKPLRSSPYYVEDEIPKRPCVYHTDILEKSSEQINGARRFLLSSDSVTGEGSFFLMAEPGWSLGNGSEELKRSEEFFVLRGVLESEDGYSFSEGTYAFHPAGSKRGRLLCNGSALIYFTVGAQS